MDLTALNINEIHRALTSRKVSAEEICREHLKRIEARDVDTRAYLTVTAERALGQAKRVDALIADEKPLPALAGVPVAVKDVIVTR
ncbi:MAG TPA: amidase family protein, partial [Terriglobia bacterium]|nr:amidase family protein [Terriglobia bacterium]